MIVLGIESSCDETAASIVQNGKDILSSVVASQIDTHHKYGGVVPELASRMHVEAITPVVDEAIKKANIKLEDIDGGSLMHKYVKQGEAIQVRGNNFLSSCCFSY